MTPKTVTWAALIGVIVISGGCEAPPQPEPKVHVKVTTHGARGDGLTDDTAAIRAALAAASTQSKPATVHFPTGRYRISGVILVDGITVEGDGPGRTVFEATDRQQAAWRLTGTNPALRQLTLRVADIAGGRKTTPDTAGIDVWDAKGFAIESVTVEGAASAGILVRRSSGTPGMPARIINCVVQDTYADGIHLTAGSSHVWIGDNRVRRSGDDFIAVVSYRDGGKPCAEIAIVGNDVADQRHGRGISVVGGRNILVAENLIRGTAGAGIYVACESGYNTLPVSQVIVRQNTLRDTGLKRAVGHGAIHLSGHAKGEDLREGLVERVLVEGNIVHGSSRDGIRIGPHAHEVTLAGNVIEGVHGNAIGIGPRAGDVKVGISAGPEQANTVKSCGGYGVYADAEGGQGELVISGNVFHEVNTRGRRSIDVIHVASGSGFSPVVIAGNRYEPRADPAIERFIECHDGDAVVTANTSTIDAAVRVARSPITEVANDER